MIRNPFSSTKSLTTSAATTEEINKIGFTAGHVHVPSGSSITSLTFYGAPSVPSGNDHESGTYTACYKSDGTTAVTMTVDDDKNFPLPTEIWDLPFIKIVADAAGDVIVSFSS